MDKDDVFVGLPYLFKMHYEDLKQAAPKLNEYLDKLKRFSEEGSREVSELKQSIDIIKTAITELFNDISTNQPKAYENTAEKSDSN